MTSIGNWAFSDCSNLTSVTITEGVTSIGENAFAHCSGLASITIPESVISIGMSAFSGCSGLTSAGPIGGGYNIEFGWTTEIPNDAFFGCSDLTNITLPEGVTSIGDNAFDGCISLTSIIIPGGVTSIGQSAFAHCSDLGAVYYVGTEAQWNTIAIGIYNDCLINATIYYNYGTSTISGTCGANLAWMLDTGTSVLTISGTGPMEDYSYPCAPWYSYRDIIQSVVIEDGVTSIGNHAFYRCSSLIGITISESVSSIGENAFSGCISLTSVTIPESVTSIGSYAFYCSSLTSVTIPESVTSIGNWAFSGCSNLTSVTITEGVTSIGESAFAHCSGLASITIPESVISIGEGAFAYCRSLTSAGPIGEGYSIEFGWTTEIPNGAFFGCSNLTNITLPEGVTSIGNFAFYSCSGLTSITIPASMVTIGGSAFYGCDQLGDVYYGGTEAQWNLIFGVYGCDNDISLSKATIHCSGFAVPIVSGTCGKNLTWTLDTGTGVLTISGTGPMDDYSFPAYAPWQTNRNAIRSAEIENGVTTIGNYAFFDCSGLTSVTIPASVTSIGGWAFNGCGSLTSVTIPEIVTSIEEYAFYGCSSLTSVMIPEGVTSIGEDAFFDCASLTSIIIPESVADIGWYAFHGCSRLTSAGPIGGGYSIEFGWTTTIPNNAFMACGSLTSVTIPESVTSIGSYAFHICDKLSDVYYGGTDAHWSTIAIGIYNDCLTNATIHYNYGKFAITQQPVDYIGKLDEYATFTVAVNEENVTYQWYYSNDGQTWKKSGSTGSTTATLTVQIKEYRLGQLYRCEVTNSEGKTVTSDAVTMQLPPSTIQILAQPVDYLGAPNDTVTFTVEATGEGLTYQWYYSSNGGETWSKSYSEGYNTPTLHPVLREYRSGQLFRCLITDANGRTEYTDAATMALKTSDITVTAQPVSYTGALNDLAEFTVTATGENLKYLWYYSEDGGATWTQTYNEGYNTPTVKVRLYAYRSGWQYKCVITSGGTVVKESAPATIAMRPVTVQITEDPMNAGGLDGTVARFHVGATGNGLSYQWQFSQDGGETWKVTGLEGAQTDTLQVEVKGYRDGWQYRCVVTDDSGTSAITKAVVLRCGAAPVITKQPVSYTGAVDSTAIFTVEATGENLRYQWQYSNDGGKTWSNSGAAEATTSTLPVQLKAYRDGQQYRCIVTNEFGSVVSAAAQLNITE